MAIKHFRSWLSDHWQPLTAYSGAIVLFLTIFTYKLRDLVVGLSALEQATVHSHSFTSIAQNPFGAPYRMLQLILFKLTNPSVFAARFASVIVALAVVGLFFYVASQWFNRRVAVVSTALVATSAWFLHYARLGNVSIMQTSLIGLIAYGTWIRSAKPNNWSLLIGVILTAVSLYTPGFIWFVLLGVLWQRKTIVGLVKHSVLASLVAAVLFLVMIVPLGLGLVKDTGLFFTLLGFKGGDLSLLSEVPQNLLQVPLQLFWRGPNNPAIWLGRLPLLDFFSFILAVLGAYSFSLDWRLDRTRVVLGGGILSWILVSLGGPVSTVILLPFCFLLVAGGIAFMLKQWFSVFPHNPFARGLAYSLIATALVAVFWYNIQHYFVAWPQSPATKAIFNRSL